MGEKEGARMTTTLEGLARRLEALEQENAELREEMAALRGSGARPNGTPAPVPALGGPGTPGTAGRAPEEPVSRRWLLNRAAAAAVGVVAAGALTQKDIRKAEAAPTVFRTTDADRGAVEAVNNAVGGIGVWGKTELPNGALSGTGVRGEGFTGVEGRAPGNGVGTGVRGEGSTGVLGRTAGGTGVRGESSAGFGVFGTTNHVRNSGVFGSNDGVGPGVEGVSINGNGVGVLGEGRFGVLGRSGFANNTAVVGEHTGTGYGVAGLGRGPNTAGVLGRHPGTGAAAGYGGQFEGAKAQMLILPRPTAGRPRSGAHQKGELYMDSAAALFVCTASGTPGTWRRVSTVVA